MCRELKVGFVFFALTCGSERDKVEAVESSMRRGEGASLQSVLHHAQG